MQTLQVKAKMSANGATRLGECCFGARVGVVIVIIHIIIIILLPESKVALFSGFHLKINSGLQGHLQGNVYAHARSCKLYKSRRK